jgi:hypothetical protein
MSIFQVKKRKLTIPISNDSPRERERERERNPMETIDDMTRLKMKILTKQVESHNPQLVFWMIYLLYHDYLL